MTPKPRPYQTTSLLADLCSCAVLAVDLPVIPSTQSRAFNLLATSTTGLQLSSQEELGSFSLIDGSPNRQFGIATNLIGP